MKNLVLLKIEGDFWDNKCTILSTTLKVEGADSFPIFFTESPVPRQWMGNSAQIEMSIARFWDYYSTRDFYC